MKQHQKENFKKLEVPVEPSNVFATADIHFFHENIIGYSERPFSNAEQMNRSIIRSWNEKIPQDADVYICGDLSLIGNEKYRRLEPVIRKLNGRKHLILGNHDRITPDKYVEIGIFSVHYPYFTLPNGWSCIHDPSLAVVFPRDSVILSGHVHNLYGRANRGPKGQAVIDVGMDAWNYVPVSLEEIQKEIDNLPQR